MDDEGKQTYSNQSTVSGSSKVMFSFFQILIFEDDISPPPQQQEMVARGRKTLFWGLEWGGNHVAKV